MSGSSEATLISQWADKCSDNTRQKTGSQYAHWLEHTYEIPIWDIHACSAQYQEYQFNLSKPTGYVMHQPV